MSRRLKVDDIIVIDENERWQLKRIMRLTDYHGNRVFKYSLVCMDKPYIVYKNLFWKDLKKWANP